MPRLEYTWDLDRHCHFLLLLLLHRAVGTVRRSLVNTPLDPSRLPLRRLYRPPLLETRSRQELMVNALRIRGREPLRSASCLLGFTIQHLFGDPGRRLLAGPSRGPRCLQDPLSFSRTPGSLQGRKFVGMYPHQAPIALRLLCLTVAFARGHGRGCRRSGPGHVVRNPLRWISVDTSMSNVS